MARLTLTVLLIFFLSISYACSETPDSNSSKHHNSLQTSHPEPLVESMAYVDNIVVSALARNDSTDLKAAHYYLTGMESVFLKDFKENDRAPIFYLQRKLLLCKKTNNYNYALELLNHLIDVFHLNPNSPDIAQITKNRVLASMCNNEGKTQAAHNLIMQNINMFSNFLSEPQLNTFAELASENNSFNPVYVDLYNKINNYVFNLAIIDKEKAHDYVMNICSKYPVLERFIPRYEYLVRVANYDNTCVYDMWIGGTI